MTKEKEYFLKLLSSFVNQTVPKGETVDLREVFRLADIHDVGGIIATQIKLTDEEYRPKNELKSFFNQVLGYSVKNNIQRENAFIKIQKFLNENEIEHIFVKGIIVKNYYPVPELRTSGDIDVIVKTDLNKLKDLAVENGIKVTDFVSNALTLFIDGLDIEIHNQPDVITSYFDNMFSLCEKDDFEYSLNEYDHLFYILCHLAKHLLYRGAGVRMLLDVDLTIRHIENFKQEKLLEIAKRTGVKKTVETILSLCKLWFNTPVKANVDLVEDCRLLNSLETVFLDGGSFGYSTNSIPLKYYKNSKSRFGVILKMAFPDREYLKICYPYYKNNPLLYPVARVNRIADGILKKKKAAKNALSQIKSDGAVNTQLELIEELELSVKE